jgi:hypothetical protein
MKLRSAPLDDVFQEVLASLEELSDCDWACSLRTLLCRKYRSLHRELLLVSRICSHHRCNEFLAVIPVRTTELKN